MGKLFVAIFLLIAEIELLCVVQKAPIIDPGQPASKGLSTPVSSPPCVFELLQTRYRFENDGTGYKETIARIRILDAKGVLQHSQEIFHYLPPSEELQIRYVRVRKRNGNLVNVDTEIGGQISSLRGAIPKPTADEWHVRVPSLSVGDMVEYDVVTVIRQPLGPSQFYVGYSFRRDCVLNEQLEIDIPRNREVKVKSIPTIKSWETTRGGRKAYHWDIQNPKSLHAGSIPYAGREPDVQVSTFKNWEEVGRWYHDLEMSQRIVTPDIKATAKELTNGLNSDLERALALYDFVAKKIEYRNAVSLGLAGYVPHSASETLRNRYGDCKDKIALFSALLEAEDLHASSVLISPDRELDPSIPSPWPFTHVITTMQLGKEQIWMDPSPLGLPFRMLLPSFRGKKALVISARDAPRLEKTPIEAPIPNSWIEEVEGKVLDDGTLEATVRISTRGDLEMLLRQAFVSSPMSLWSTTVQAIVKGIDRRNDNIRDVKISDPAATSELFTLSFCVRRTHFINFSQEIPEFKFPLATFDLPSAVESGVTDRNGGWHRIKSEPVLLGPPGKRIYNVSLEFPPGFYPQLPESVFVECLGGSYRATYNWNGISLTVDRELILSRKQLPPLLRAQYSTFRTRVVEDTEQILQARTKGARILPQM